MKKFIVRISDWIKLFYSPEDIAKSQGKSKELKVLVENHQNVLAESEKAREILYWPAYEGLRRGRVLGYQGGKLQELQIALWQAEAAVTGPLKEESDRWHKLCGQIELSSRPLREEIVSILERYILEVQSIRGAQELSRQSNFELEISVTEDNFSQCEKMLDLLIKFKAEIRSMTEQSFSEILEKVKVFELQANSIDVFEMEQKEFVRPIPVRRDL